MGFRIQEGGNWKSEIGNWKLETGNWKLVASASFHFLVSIFFPVQFLISSFRPPESCQEKPWGLIREDSRCSRC